MNLKQYFFIQERIGKGGKPFNIYKIRTMDDSVDFPLEEVLESIENGPYGKVEDDPRCTRLGKILRKYWIDELPQFANIIKGEMSLVGPRPICKEWFERRPLNLRNERIKYKPGLMNPSYVTKFNGFQRAIELEFLYLKRKRRYPILTDIDYFLKILGNIVFKGARGV